MEKPSILEGLTVASREAASRRESELPRHELLPLLERYREREGRFAEALRGPGLSVIAEHKRRSPSKGIIREDWSVEQTVRAYEAGGARAISVLTEESRFGGSLDHLREARAATDLPILRKDFISESYQLLESKAAGADAVLLIAAALEESELAELHAEARELELDVLVEVHDEKDIERAVRAQAEIIGINNRDLRDPELRTDTGTTKRLLEFMPEGVTVVTESGFQMDVESRQLLVELRGIGVDAVLIGEALMREPDPESSLRFLDRNLSG